MSRLDEMANELVGGIAQFILEAERSGALADEELREAHYHLRRWLLRPTGEQIELPLDYGNSKESPESIQ